MADPYDLFYLPFRPAFDANGIIVAGASLTFYTSGTSTLQQIFADAALMTPLANPLTANSAGVWPSIYIDNSKTYRVVLRDGNGSVLNEVDPYVPGSVGGSAGATGPANSTYPTAAAIRASALPTNLSAILASGTRRDLYVWVTGSVPTTGTADIDYITSTVSTAGYWSRQDGPLFAGNFGVAGNAASDGAGNITGTDDTAAVQAFQTLCASMNRIAYYGSLRPRLTGPVTIHNGSCVFDRQSFTATGESAGVSRGEPGFYVSGSGYTALTVSGICTEFCVTVCGGGDATTDAAGNITADTRPNVVGIQFGNPLGAANGTLILSNISWARTTKLSGVGIRVTNAFDCRFGASLTEGCGDADGYAMSIEDGGNTTNECVFTYIQSEFGKQKALYISPNLVSCVFLKIHSERATSKDGVPAWVLGPAEYSAVRLNSMNRLGRCEIVAQYGDIRGLKPENVRVAVNSTGGAFTFHDAQFSQGVEAMTGSNGIVNFFGCSGFFHNVQPGWHIQGGVADEINVGPCTAGYFPTVRDMQVAALRPTDSTAAVAVISSRVESLRSSQWADVRITVNSRAVAEGGAQTFAQMKLTIDSTSKLVGNITMNSVGLRCAGRIEGNLSLQSPRQTLFGATAEVTGTITGNGAPEGDSYLDGAPNGSYSKNLTPAAAGAAGAQYIVTHWQKVGGAWTECRSLTGA